MSNVVDKEDIIRELRYQVDASRVFGIPVVLSAKEGQYILDYIKQLEGHYARLRSLEN